MYYLKNFRQPAAVTQLKLSGFTVHSTVFLSFSIFIKKENSINLFVYTVGIFLVVIAANRKRLILLFYYYPK